MKKINETARYGVAEWYGHLVPNLTREQLEQFAEIGNTRLSGFPCPFRRGADPEAKCNKKGGVCSLSKHVQISPTEVQLDGPLVTLCPSRFWADNKIFAEIGRELLGTSEPALVKEVPFLSSIVADDEQAAENETSEALGAPVGRIDTILVDPNEWSTWCALEIQAVYFSGEGMGTHLAQYKAPASGIVFPDKTRRPDFRSSGPKRLMPQLQTKVPTLRRWGKKMAVVIDLPFLNSLGRLQPVKYVSNSDIVWFVIDYETATGELSIVKMIPTTLESSVEALTAGIPMSLEDFEADVHRFLTGRLKKERAKVIRLASTVASEPGDGGLFGGNELPESQAADADKPAGQVNLLGSNE